MGAIPGASTGDDGRDRRHAGGSAGADAARGAGGPGGGTRSAPVPRRGVFRAGRRPVPALAALTVLTGTLLAAALPAALPPGSPAGTTAHAAPADFPGGLILVLDASGSMAEDDGTGTTRMDDAREALGTAVDALPEGYPTGLRLYGSESSDCTDTRLAQPVGPVDPGAIREALGSVGPTGNTPTSLALERAVEDLPEVPHGAIARRTVLLISDGESNCDEEPPCEVAERLAGDGVDLRIDTVGFRIGEEGRAELECVAEAGHGTYYDAPDGEALGRELERAARLSADGYRFEGEEVEGGPDAGAAPALEPGRYLDRIGPGETRWYGVDLDEVSTADLAVTAVPHPGVAVNRRDGLRLTLSDSSDKLRRCVREDVRFGDDEGAMILTGAVARVPSPGGTSTCDAAGRYLLSVERESEEDSDGAHWPIELRVAVEEPLPDGVRPAASATSYGAAGPDAPLPTDEPVDIEGGTGFNDAVELAPGVHRDRLLPAQTRFYRVPVGWGQQLRYRVEFGNEPTLEGSPGSSWVRTVAYAPHRAPIGRGDFRTERPYRGEESAVDMGTVPVTWTNRYESSAAVAPVRAPGDHYIAVSLGPGATEIARNAAIGVVLRVDVVGEELTGPGHDATPVAAGDGDEAGAGDGDADGERNGDGGDDSGTAGDAGAADGAGWGAPLLAALAGAGAVLVIAGIAFAVARARAPRPAPARPATGAVAGPAAGRGVAGIPPGAPGGTHDGTNDTRGDR
ncbi:VWA domain-containing protein [Streptomyces sp. ST2-7A]|uniref:VWA domain-containing protein n=1 Tax=Streptomyces sp. ST2-7A TaxID=2907214 RepID=UPI001F31AC18|nr:VWA domain-containing protein [Streptomyces sp. ST2-7A]MCE7080698.1 VWA domain-containing protein [Streptomyces sp. ST2-7A]